MKSIEKLINYPLFILSLFLFSIAVNAQKTGNKEIYAVGFKYEWLRNYAQNDCGEMAVTSLGKQILLGIWYPAKKSNKKAMQLGDYVNLKGLKEPIKIVDALREYSKESWLAYTMQDYSDSTFKQKKQAFEASLTFQTLAQMDSKPLKQQFPVVIYHHGAAGTYDDNALMCEYLASQGYVVISSTFLQCMRQTVFEGSDWKANASDLQTILTYVQQQPNMDVNKVALMGHSRGCQIGYAMTMGRAAPYKCFIGLDPTWDGKSYEQLYTDWQKPNILHYLHDNKSKLLTSIFHIASFRKNTGIDEDSAKLMNAQYQMQFPVTDLFTHAERTMVTTDEEHSHDAFISQGGHDYARMLDRINDPEEKSYVEKQIAAYELVCELVLNYLDDKLKNQAKPEFWKNLSTEKLIKRYELRQATPVPTLQAEWPAIIEQQGLKGLTERLNKEKEASGYHHFSHEYLAQHFFHKNRELSKAIIDQHASMYPQSWKTPFLQGTYAYNIGEIETAQNYYKKALQLSPPEYMLDFLQKGYFYSW